MGRLDERSPHKWGFTEGLARSTGILGQRCCVSGLAWVVGGGAGGGESGVRGVKEGAKAGQRVGGGAISRGFEREITQRGAMLTLARLFMVKSRRETGTENFKGSVKRLLLRTFGELNLPLASTRWLERMSLGDADNKP